MSAALALTDAQRLVDAWRIGVCSLPNDRVPCPGMIGYPDYGVESLP